MLRLLLVPLLTTSFLSGCAQTPSSPAPVPGLVEGVRNDCPTLVEYTRDQLAKLDVELQTIPPEWMVWVFVKDYGILRQQVRACGGLRG